MLALTLAAALLAAADTGGHGVARVEHGFDVFPSDADWPAWHATSAVLETRIARIALIAEATRIERFARSDYAAALESYAPLWRGAYGRTRVQFAPGADVIARADAAVDVYQAVGRWETSAGYRQFVYADERLGLVSAGLAWQPRGWYLLARVAVVADADDPALSAGVAARRLRSDGGLVELSAGGGEEVVDVRAGTPDVRPAWSVAARAVHFLSPRWGLSATAGYAAVDRVPSRASVALGSLLRW